MVCWNFRACFFAMLVSFFNSASGRPRSLMGEGCRHEIFHLLHMIGQRVQSEAQRHLVTGRLRAGRQLQGLHRLLGRLQSGREFSLPFGRPGGLGRPPPDWRERARAALGWARVFGPAAAMPLPDSRLRSRSVRSPLALLGAGAGTAVSVARFICRQIRLIFCRRRLPVCRKHTPKWWPALAALPSAGRCTARRRPAPAPARQTPSARPP